jgi:signal transduction histidine kinase
MQILVNLIGNAIRYSPAQSAISISFERRQGFAVVNVADNGPGIPAADQERIFERFEQGKSGGPGSGLGLAIARRLARGMGGEIELQSQPGVGSTFTLVLPAAS